MNRSVTHVEYRNNKSERPFQTGLAMHITLRSEIAKGDLSMASERMRSWIRSYVPALARRFGIRLYHASNNGNHLHIVGQFPTKSVLSLFLRVVSGMIARKILKAEKGKRGSVKFWTERPYSRLVSWGTEFNRVILYVHRNLLESRGRISYMGREYKVSKLLNDFIKQSWESERRSIQQVLSGQLTLEFR